MTAYGMQYVDWPGNTTAMWIKNNNIIKVSGMILGIISFLVFIGAVACFIQKDMATGKHYL